MTVYFMREVGTDLVKIGRSSSPLRRRAGVRYAYEELDELVVERTVEPVHPDLDDPAEKYAHGLALESRVRRELFRLSPGAVEEVAAGTERMLCEGFRGMARAALDALICRRPSSGLADRTVEAGGWFAFDAMVTVASDSPTLLAALEEWAEEKMGWLSLSVTATQITRL